MSVIDVTLATLQKNVCDVILMASCTSLKGLLVRSNDVSDDIVVRNTFYVGAKKKPFYNFWHPRLGKH